MTEERIQLPKEEADTLALAKGTRVQLLNLIIAIDTTCRERGMDFSDACLTVASSIIQSARLKEADQMKILYAIANAMGDAE